MGFSNFGCHPKHHGKLLQESLGALKRYEWEWNSGLGRLVKWCSWFLPPYMRWVHSVPRQSSVLVGASGGSVDPFLCLLVAVGRDANLQAAAAGEGAGTCWAPLPAQVFSIVHVGLSFLSNKPSTVGSGTCPPPAAWGKQFLRLSCRFRLFLSSCLFSARSLVGLHLCSRETGDSLPSLLLLTNYFFPSVFFFQPNSKKLSSS